MSSNSAAVQGGPLIGYTWNYPLSKDFMLKKCFDDTILYVLHLLQGFLAFFGLFTIDSNGVAVSLLGLRSAENSSLYNGLRTAKSCKLSVHLIVFASV